MIRREAVDVSLHFVVVVPNDFILESSYTKHLVQQVDNLPAGAPDKVHWQVIGIGARQWPLAAAAVSLGGNVRVGLEDNLYVAPGQLARSNGELVGKAAELVRLVGGEVATVAEAREMLQLPRFQ